MHKHYVAYHDIIFMDATYNTNRHGNDLVFIAGMNSEGRNCILAMAILTAETIENY